MLERDTLFVRRGVGRRGAARFTFDSDSGERLGQAIEIVPRWASLLRGIFGPHALTRLVEIREALDDSLLAVVHLTGDRRRPQAEVQDAQKSVVGRLAPFTRGAFSLWDRDGTRVATIESMTPPWRWTSPDGRFELVMAVGDARSMTLQFHEVLAGQPLTKLLLLAGCVALTMDQDR